MELKHIIEALLFAADRPLTPRDIRRILAEARDEENPGVTESFRATREAAIAAALQELKVEWDTTQRSFELVEVGGGWRLVSRPEFAPWLAQLHGEARPYRLSPPALETLAIIALRQPIARADIAAIRGVEVDGVLKTLLERDLITIVGKSDAPGHPMLYGTTQKFLEHFGLRSLDDMPKAAELRQQAAMLRSSENRAPTATSTASTAPVAPAESAASPSTANETQPTNPAPSN
ncbi:MAG: SMC-Scp complex subunit ScpB [Verrucomicrobiae bacterium]|nr:SMC-Scp complex subunit ScpB [Verrucomicrobiae bacterium]